MLPQNSQQNHDVRLRPVADLSRDDQGNEGLKPKSRLHPVAHV